MSTAPQRRPLTEQEYLLIERQAQHKSEFYRGEIFAMAGATREHNVIAHNLSRHLGNLLAGRDCDVYQSDMKVRIAATGRYAYPDVVVACSPRQFADDKQDVLLNPTFLAEVLSDSTSAYDRGDKASDYRSLDSLREFALVAQDQPLVEHYIRQDAETWTVRQIAGLDGVLTASAAGGGIRLADIYAGIDFGAGRRPTLRVADDDLQP